MYAPVLFEVADLDQLEIVAEVVEWDAHRVHVGQIAEITGLGGKPVFGTGRVVRRGAAMTPPTVVLDPTMVRSDGPALPVTIELDEPLEPAPPLGMRVEAHIQVASVAVDARIPRAALGLKEGQAWVRLPRWFRAREVPVELGVVGRAFIEVQGLAVGTDVHVLRPEPTNVGADHAITL
jgi:hypothetical protein